MSRTGRLAVLLLAASTILVSPAAAPAPAEEPPAAHPRTVLLRVVDRLDRPVADVTACLLPACAKLDLRPGKDGLLATLPPGDGPVLLRVSARAFAPADVKVDLGLPAVEVKLKAKGSIRAAFLSVDEKRSVPMSVSLKETVDPAAGTKGRPLVSREASLAPRPASNAVVFDDVPRGEWVLSWEGAGLSYGSKAVRVDEIRADAGTFEVRAGRVVEGAVRDDLGMVVAGARVRLRAGTETSGRPMVPARSARSGSDGGFSVSGLPLDEVLAWDVRSEGHEDATGALGGETRLEIVLVRAQRVSGRLVDEEKLPVAGADVEVAYTRTDVTKDAQGNESQSVSIHGHRDRIATKDDGTFSFFRQSPASVRIAPRGSELLPSTHELDPLGEMEDRRDVDIGDLVLRKGRTLTGRVSSAQDGTPVAGARLEAIWKEEQRMDLGTAWSVTAPDGTFRLTGLLPGRDVTLTARKEGFAPRTVTVDPESGSIDVLLGRGGRIEGRVCGTAWEISHVAIWYGVGGAISNQNRVDPDASGRFVLENAEPGTITLARSWRFRDPASPAAASDWSGAVRIAVEVREGETTRTALACDGIPLSGVVTRGGRPAAAEIVTFSLGGSQATDALLDAAGSFSTRVPAPGRWLLGTYRGSPGTSAAAFCEVPPGGLEGCRVELAPPPQ